MKKSQPGRLFIVGVGRSGTSLLQSMLNAHPAICFPPEINFIRRFLATTTLEKMSQSNKESLLNFLLEDELIARLDLDKDIIKSIVSSLSNNFSSKDIYISLINEYASKIGKADIAWLGDKDPRAVEYLPLIHRCFPMSKILHIIRDPRDVLASKKKSSWSKDHSVLRHIFANRVQLKIGRQQGHQLFGSRYMELSYEQLISDAKAVLNKISDFLDIDFNPNMLEFSNSSKLLVSKDELQWKKETLGPLLKNNFGKWKNDLSPLEVALSEQICSQAFNLMNYEKTDAMNQLGFSKHIFVFLMKSIMTSLDPVYRCYRKNAAAK